MDDEDDKKDGDIAVPDAAIEEVLGEDVEDDDLAAIDPLSVINEFGEGGDVAEKWE